MAVEFVCRNCGKSVRLAGDPGERVPCPHCGRQMDRADGAPRPAEDGQAAGGAIGRAVPWAVSLLFHAAVALALWFGVMLVVHEGFPERVTVPDAFLTADPGGVMSPAEHNWQHRVRKAAVVPERHHSPRDSAIPVEIGKTDRRIRLIGAPAAGGYENPFSLDSGGQTTVRSSFFGRGGNAHHIVYVVDYSGSMLDSFNYVRREILRSVSRLKLPQDFHVILFYGGGRFLESPPKQLVPATFESKERLAGFLEGVVPQGSAGDLSGGQVYASNAVPALERAFAVLSRSGKRPGKLIYLLSDGLLGNTEDVLAAVRKANRSKEVRLNTYLFWFKDEQAMDLMKRLAQENGGQFKYISPEE